ncbi:MAG TPA: HAD family hydrolase [Methyloprofundus sp.]|uniref:HAD family hydrolase n=1 Tax=Methyloprofundus sp. TaxID=2020875 RepID=UPI0018513CBA|nr:HAD-IA family hydrolase [Methyloprofundus sp.]HIG65781.1 HAD family hydrolase [Methyloprofundus sp.]HIL78097.1 HAD family hydrolase [Methylococcales bacterium]
MNNEFSLSCVLFDLDGTLLNTAPDLTTALNKALEHYNYPDVSEHVITPYISYGAVAMIETALDREVDAETKADILVWLLDYYEKHIADFTQLYPGMSELLTTLEAENTPWGVITNKRERMTHPLMQAMKLTQRSACIICGDTTAYSKPHPEPMLAACRQIQVMPEQCLYIGDAQHDITAGKAANMKTLAATWGYLKPDDKPQDWGADALIHHPKQILEWITNQSNAFN